MCGWDSSQEKVNPKNMDDVALCNRVFNHNMKSIPINAELTIDQAFKQAIAHHQAGQLQDAERLYRAILQAQPNHPDANHNLGVLAVQVKQPAAGLPYFKTALEANPKQEQYWLSYIDALIQTGQTEAARQVLAQGRQRGLQGKALETLACRLDQSEHAVPDQSIEHKRAIEHREAGRYKEAVLILQNWLVSNPQDASAHALLAQALSLDTQDDSAWVALNTALSINPALPIVQRNHARLLLKQQKTDEAQQAAQAAYQNDATDPENLLVLASVLRAKGQNERAWPLVEFALQRRPNYAEAYANRALLRLGENEFVGALADAEMALSIKPQLGQLWGMVGTLRHQLKNLPGAIDALEKALDFEPDNVGHLVNLGEFKRQAGEVEAAIAMLEKATTIAPVSATAWVNLGTALQQAKRMPEAKAAYAKALEISPEQAEVASNLGALAKEEENWEEALRYFNQAVEIRPDFAEAHNNLGATLKDLGRLDEAAASYRRAQQIKPEFAEALCNLGNTLCDLDDLQRAAVIYEKVWDIEPANSGLEAAVNLAILGYLEGNLEKCKSNLLASQPIMAKADPRFNNSRTYWRYIDKLLSLWQQQAHRFNQMQSMATLHVIGDSHSLTAHGVVIRYNGQKMRCEAEWIAGCKQWHLGNSKPNRYKHKFEAVMARLPRQSTILLTIGEIDCRSDEGMTKAYKKSPDRLLEEIAQATANAYVNFVKNIAARHGHQLIISGVPATNTKLDAMTADDRQQFVHLIRQFNVILKEYALAAEMSFLDVYALTDRGGGIASSQWHIDNIHLLPSAMVEAFARHCIHPQKS